MILNNDQLGSKSSVASGNFGGAFGGNTEEDKKEEQ